MIDLEERFIEKKSFFNRLLVIYIFFGLVFSFFLLSTYSLQISEYDEYEVAALKNKTKEVLVQPERGIIYDRSGNIIVNNVPTYDLIIKPSKIKNPSNFISEISEVIEIDKDDIDYFLENFLSKANYNRELIL
jgi:penicillin-binding protein 2